MSDDQTPLAEDAVSEPAAELVLGLLEGLARVAAVERQRSDPAFRAAVEAWERRLAPLLDQVAPIEAPPGVWDRIAPSIETGANVVALAPRPALEQRGLLAVNHRGLDRGGRCLLGGRLPSPRPAGPSRAHLDRDARNRRRRPAVSRHC